MLFLILIIISCTSCRLSSLGNGDCLPSSNISLSFCKGQVEKTICVPQSQVEWNWTSLAKDSEVRAAFIIEVEKIIELEVKGVGGEFSKNIDCTNTLKALMCQINFPYCVNDTSYAVCGKGCEFLLKNCLTTVNICELSEFVVPNISFCSFAEFLSVVWLVVIFSY